MKWSVPKNIFEQNMHFVIQIDPFIHVFSKKDIKSEFCSKKKKKLKIAFARYIHNCEKELCDKKFHGGNRHFLSVMNQL